MFEEGISIPLRLETTDTFVTENLICSGHNIESLILMAHVYNARKKQLKNKHIL